MGHSQSFILNTAFFENNILHLAELMLPNLMSSTMSLEDLLAKTNSGNSNKSQKSSEGQNVGRPEKSDD